MFQAVLCRTTIFLFSLSCRFFIQAWRYVCFSTLYYIGDSEVFSIIIYLLSLFLYFKRCTVYPFSCRDGFTVSMQVRSSVGARLLSSLVSHNTVQFRVASLSPKSFLKSFQYRLFIISAIPVTQHFNLL